LTEHLTGFQNLSGVLSVSTQLHSAVCNSTLLDSKIWLFALQGQRDAAGGFILRTGNSLIIALKGRREIILRPFRARDALNRLSEDESSGCILLPFQGKIQNR